MENPMKGIMKEEYPAPARKSSRRRWTITLASAILVLLTLAHFNPEQRQIARAFAVSRWKTAPDAWFPFGSLVFHTPEGEARRWQTMLEGLYKLEDSHNPEPGCPPDWYIIKDNNALSSFEDLARQHTRQPISAKRGGEILEELGIDAVVLTVSGLKARQDRLRQALAREGIVDFVWQVGWDLKSLPEHLDTVRQTLANKMPDLRILKPDISLSMKQAVTLLDWTSGTPKAGSRYVGGQADATSDAPIVHFPRRRDNGRPRHLLVMEDDTILVPDFLSRLRTVMADLPEDYAFMSIGACCNAHCEATKTTPTNHKLGPFTFEYTRKDAAVDRGWPWVRCLGTYLVNSKAAPEIGRIISELAVNRTNVEAIDFHYNAVLQEDVRSDRHKLGKTFWAEPPLSFQSTKAIFDDQGRTESSLRIMDYHIGTSRQ